MQPSCLASRRRWPVCCPNIEPSIPANLISMIPYVVTIVAVAGFVGKSRAPAAENIPYVK